MARIWAIVPAAGKGLRFGGEIPKQYQLLQGEPVLFHTLRTLLAEPAIEQVLLVLAPDDRFCQPAALAAAGLQSTRLRIAYVGGESRAETVANGLRQLACQEQDWVLVHDAARCCLPPASLRRLIDDLADDLSGGILALPVADTLKRADAQQRVLATVAREKMWQAQTPQMFRTAILRAALAQDPAHFTDEASAVEALGHPVKLVLGSPYNFKLTYAEDMALAEAVLKLIRTT